MRYCLSSSQRQGLFNTCKLSTLVAPQSRLITGPSIQSRLYTSTSAADLQFGQPVHETHPHLLRPGELTPGVTALEYAQRRSKLASKLPKNAVAVLAAADVKYRSGPVFYEFHQESNFFYLTGLNARLSFRFDPLKINAGFNEPEAVAVIAKTTNDNDHTFHLFVRSKDPKAEQWEGSRSGEQAAIDIFNADETGDINDVERHLAGIIADASEVHTDLQPKPTATSGFARLFSNTYPKGEAIAKLFKKATVRPLQSTINAVRNIKSNSEIANMRRAGQASGRAFTEAMRQAWTSEKDLASFLEYRFKRHGCDGSAYVPVVAGGRNASQIHYVRNDDVLSESSLVLADAGGEYGNYITDITRTWPISGAFSDPEKDLYNALLTTQRTCISLCRASASNSLDKLHEIAENLLQDSLSQLGFNMSGNALETLFPHHLGHYIGLDVHDTPGQSRKTPLQTGQCVTIEPGLYVPDTEDFPAAFRGMGMRIEDSICVLDEHPLVLTTEAVKEVDDIEALRS